MLPAVGVLADVDVDVAVECREVVLCGAVDVEHLRAVDAEEQRRAPVGAGRHVLRHEHRDVCGVARDRLPLQRRALREVEVVAAKPQVLHAVGRGRVRAIPVGLVLARAQRAVGHAGALHAPQALLKAPVAHPGHQRACERVCACVSTSAMCV